MKIFLVNMRRKYKKKEVDVYYGSLVTTLLASCGLKHHVAKSVAQAVPLDEEHVAFLRK